MDPLHARIHLLHHVVIFHKPVPPLWNLLNELGSPGFIDAAIKAIAETLLYIYSRTRFVEILENLELTDVPVGRLPPYDSEEFLQVVREIESIFAQVDAGEIVPPTGKEPWQIVVWDALVSWKRISEQDPHSKLTGAWVRNKIIVKMWPYG